MSLIYNVWQLNDNGNVEDIFVRDFRKKKLRQRHLSSLSHSQSVAMNQSLVAMTTQVGQGNLTSEETIQDGAVSLPKSF